MKIDLNRAVEVLTALGYECDEIESLRQCDELKADSGRLDWLLNKVGVSRDNGRSYVWMPGGSTKLDAEDRLNSLRAIDAAIAAARRPE